MRHPGFEPWEGAPQPVTFATAPWIKKLTSKSLTFYPWWLFPVGVHIAKLFFLFPVGFL